MTRGDGLRERTARVADEEPPQAKEEREAFPQREEQTEQGNHPVDGSPKRIYGPQRQYSHSTTKLSLDTPPVASQIGLLICEERL